MKLRLKRIIKKGGGRDGQIKSRHNTVAVDGN